MKSFIVMVLLLSTSLIIFAQGNSFQKQSSVPASRGHYKKLALLNANAVKGNEAPDKRTLENSLRKRLK